MAVYAEAKQKPANAGTGNFPKYLGYFEGKVLAINPTAEEYFDIYQREPQEKSVTYLSTETDGTAKCTVVIHLQDVKTKNIFQAYFYLTDKKAYSSSGNKYFINTIGETVCCSSEDTIPSYFLDKGRDYRQAYEGEIHLVKFLKIWLGNLDFRKPEAVLQLDWKKVISGNLKEWKELVGHEWTITVGALAGVKIDDTAEGTKVTQKIFTKSFFSGYWIKNMRMLDLTNRDVLRGAMEKRGTDYMRNWQTFLKDVTGAFGCTFIYELKELSVYDPEQSPENGKVISTDGPEL